MKVILKNTECLFGDLPIGDCFIRISDRDRSVLIKTQDSYSSEAHFINAVSLAEGASVAIQLDTRVIQVFGAWVEGYGEAHNA